MTLPTPSADLSAQLMTAHILEEMPFSYWRFGDGALECMFGLGTGRQTCDGERYTDILGLQLAEAMFSTATCARRVYWGDWATADGGSAPRYLERWKTVPKPDNLLHYEALLLMRRSPALLEFYRAVKQDARVKVYVGPDAGAAIMMGAFGVITRRGGSVDSDWILNQLRLLHPEVILFGAGMAGLIGVAKYWEAHPGVTAVHLGSALDPLFAGATRASQLTPATAAALFKPLLIT